MCAACLQYQTMFWVVIPTASELGAQWCIRFLAQGVMLCILVAMLRCVTEPFTGNLTVKMTNPFCNKWKIII